MKIILAFLLLSTSLITSFPQANTETTYYKNRYLTKEIKAKKAHFIKTITISNDTVKAVRINNIETGFVVIEEYYINNIPSGVWNVNTNDGKIIKSRDFSQLTFLSEPKDFPSKYSIDELDSTLLESGSMNKGITTYSKNLQSRMSDPKQTPFMSNRGISYIQFIIDKKGQFKLIGVIGISTPYLSYEAVECLKQNTQWTPTKYNGKKISSMFILPIRGGH